jgi:hypothetical protein
VPFYPPTVRYPRIFQDVPCDRCGYNLRGMHVGAQCPECGQYTFSSYNRHRARKFDMKEFTVASSDDPEKPRARAVYKHFRRLDATWLRKLALGTTLLCAGNVLSSASAWVTWVGQLYGAIAQPLRWTMHLTAWALCAAGAILLVTPEPLSPLRCEQPVSGVARAGIAMWWLTPLLVFAGSREDLGRAGLMVLAAPITLVALCALARALWLLDARRLSTQIAALAVLLPAAAIVLLAVIPADATAGKIFFELAPVPGIGSGSTMLAFTDQYRALMGSHDSIATLLAMAAIALFVWTQLALLLAGAELRRAAKRYADMMKPIPSRSSTAFLPPA